MKILFISNGMHAKNLYALQKYNIDMTIIYDTNLENVDLTQFDVVYSPCTPIDVSKYPNSNFLFGPHFSVYPEKQHIELIKGNQNVIYTQPSNWARDVWINNPLSNGIRIETLPFGVDTIKFNKLKSINNREEVFVYFKNRNPYDLDLVKNFLNSKNILYRIFSYQERYSETDYLNYLKESKYGIWIDAHESQGFALQEALSCGIPLLVWNVKSMNQAYGYNCHDIPATTVPYWDERCGEVFYHFSELENTFNKFTNNIENYDPRQYILENLSMEICEKKLVNLIENIVDKELVVYNFFKSIGLSKPVDISEIIIDSINNKKPIAFLKFGDGEHNCIFAPYGANCDNDRYTEKLSNALRNAFINITNKNNPNYFIGRWNNKDVINNFKQLSSNEINYADYHTFIMLGGDNHMEGFLDKKKFKIYKAIKESKIKKIMVCNNLMYKSEKLLDIDHMFYIPQNNWFDNLFEYLLDEISNVIKDNEPFILLTSCGMSAKVLIYELINKYDNGLYFDIGSALDFLCRKYITRGYENLYSYEYLTDLFKEIIPENWDNI